MLTDVADNCKRKHCIIPYHLEAKIPSAIGFNNKLQYDTDKKSLEKKIEDVDKRIPNIDDE